MEVPEGGLFSTEEPSVERTITGEVSSQGSNAKLVLTEYAGSLANSSPAEWLITIMNDGDESSSGESQPKTPKIPKIPKMFRDIGSSNDCYDPLVVSIGPYHHGKPELQKMEKLKIKMAKQYVMETREKSIQASYKKVEEVAGEAKKYYDFDSSSAIDDESFTKMMFLDGCFVLQYMYLSVHGQQDMGMKIHHTAYVRRDLFLVENQLPYIVLKALMSTRFIDSEGKNMIDRFIKLNQAHHRPPQSRRNRFGWLRVFINYICSCIDDPDQTAELPTIDSSSIKDDQPPHLLESAVQAAELPTKNRSSTKDDQPLHLLDMMRKAVVGPKAKAALGAKSTGPEVNWSQRYQSAKELKTVRITFRPNKSGCYTDVRFTTAMFFYGRVTLPRLIVNDSTKSMLLNMVAFETCADGPDDFWVTSYICFMDSLINNAEDVSVLRSQNILVNCLSTDQEVADLFNDIGKYLAPNPRAYAHVKNGIRAHYNNVFKKWMAKWLVAFFSSPWFVGSIFAIFLGAIETYTALRPQSIIHQP
ncbi:hypothetical protein FNV43_RR16417 [Rhamnella rubrinervis]|uniref:Uncharacterized protein n=1 Tax=Rhamnella rubrinervis TaxID=2594499 RepID=A0A8K0GYR2_9ROSA|nr:hypothetical protein FNV43_RR16417 [Rhamnella rubrinervis]